MAEETTESFVSTINVRELISIFENKRTENIDYSYSRPRAKSWGNILADDVVVRYSDYYTLEDIKKALDKVETNLNFYQVYDKQKHVAFQEQLFNILTSVVNIETGDDDPSHKKTLITKTQTLVSYLNQKLPNVRSPLKQLYTKNLPETKNDTVEDDLVFEQPVENVTNNTEQSGPVLDTDYSVSVRKLKKHFQTTDETDADILPTKNAKLRTQKSHEVVPNQKTDEHLVTDENDLNNVDISKQTEDDIGNSPDNDKKDVEVASKERKFSTSEDIEPEEVAKVVSVSKLRNMFEEKSKDDSAGLEVVLDAPRTFHYEVTIPYTEGNLGKYRLYRANSGNYLNYQGLLQQTDINRKKTDLNRSKSMHAFNYDKYVAYKDRRNKVIKRSPEDSGEESDTSSSSIDSVKEVPVNQLSAVKVQVENIERLTRTIDVQNEEKYQTATSSEPEHSQLTIANQSTRTVTTEEVQHSSVSSSIRVGNEELLTRTADEEKEENFQSSTLADPQQSHFIITNESARPGTIEEVQYSTDQSDKNEIESSTVKNKPLLGKRNPFASDVNKKEDNSSSAVQDENEIESSTLTVKLNRRSDVNNSGENKSTSSPDKNEIESVTLRVVPLLSKTNAVANNTVQVEENTFSPVQVSEDKTETSVLETNPFLSKRNVIIERQEEPHVTNSDQLDENTVQTFAISVENENTTEEEQPENTAVSSNKENLDEKATETTPVLTTKYADTTEVEETEHTTEISSDKDQLDEKTTEIVVQIQPVTKIENAVVTEAQPDHAITSYEKDQVDENAMILKNKSVPNIENIVVTEEKQPENTASSPDKDQPEGNVIDTPLETKSNTTTSEQPEYTTETSLDKDKVDGNTTETVIETTSVPSTENVIVTENEQIGSTAMTSADKEQVNENDTETVVETKPLANSDNAITEQEQPETAATTSVDRDQPNDNTTEAPLETTSVSNTENVVAKEQPEATTISLDKDQPDGNITEIPKSASNTENAVIEQPEYTTVTSLDKDQLTENVIEETKPVSNIDTVTNEEPTKRTSITSLDKDQLDEKITERSPNNAVETENEQVEPTTVTSLDKDKLKENETESSPVTSIKDDDVIENENPVQTTEDSVDKDQLDENANKITPVSRAPNVGDDEKPEHPTVTSLDKAEKKENIEVTSERKLLASNNTATTNGTVQSPISNGETSTVFKVDEEAPQHSKQTKTVQSKNEATIVSGYSEEQPPAYSTVNDVADISMSSINTVKTDFSIDEEALNTAEEDFDRLLESNEIQ